MCYPKSVKLLILYRPNSEHETTIMSFVRDFQRRYEAGRKVGLVSLDTRDGAAMASLYGVVRYPAILVIGDDGAMANLWEGEPLPLMDEVASYARSVSN